MERTSQGEKSPIVQRPSVWGSSCASAACPRTGLLPTGLAACLALVSCVALQGWAGWTLLRWAAGRVCRVDVLCRGQGQTIFWPGSWLAKIRLVREVDAVNLLVWLWLIINDRKFLVEIVFFSHINQPAVFFYEPATI